MLKHVQYSQTCDVVCNMNEHIYWIYFMVLCVQNMGSDVAPSKHQNWGKGDASRMKHSLTSRTGKLLDDTAFALLLLLDSNMFRLQRFLWRRALDFYLSRAHFRHSSAILCAITFWSGLLHWARFRLCRRTSLQKIGSLVSLLNYTLSVKCNGVKLNTHINIVCINFLLLFIVNW